MRFSCVCVALALCLACDSDDSDDDAGVLDAGADASDDAGQMQDVGMDAPEVSDVGPVDAHRPRPDVGPPPSACDRRSDEPPLTQPLEPIEVTLAGPGGPQRSFEEAERLVRCASLDGGERDPDHHNTVLMLDGYLWMPWAHEAGEGAISVFEISDPCAPVEVSTSWHQDMRETHAAGAAYIDGRRWMVTASLTGIMFWDITDPTDVRMAYDLTLPDVVYPDSYDRVVMSTFWQAPYVYVGASDNGVFVVDASNPQSPELVTQYQPEPDFRVGGVHAIGTLLVILPSEGSRTALVDISLPDEPRPIPGGSWLLDDGMIDRLGRPIVRAAYASHVSGNQIFYARHIIGGGLIIYDISDPVVPTFVGTRLSPDFGANGGYVFVKEDQAFVGLSGFGEVMDVSDPSSPTKLARVDMEGDVDTLVPVGNVIMVSVDDEAIPGEATNIYPWQLEPDTQPPVVNMVVPADGAEQVSLAARVGLTFNEPVDVESLSHATFYVRRIDEDGMPMADPLVGYRSGQEGAVSFWPQSMLEPDARYEVVVPAGGVVDATGNPTAIEHRSTFRTASCEM